jgi:Uma2 family endonuclease
MSTVTEPVTAEQFWELARDGQRKELVKGEVRLMPPAGAEHGFVAMSFGARLTLFVQSNKLGAVFAAETGFVIGRHPDTVRAADVAFVTKKRLPPGGIPVKFFPGAPDVAVEVVSPSDTFDEVEDKVGEWLTAGSQLVLVVSPAKKLVKLYRSSAQTITLDEKEEFTAPDLLPGFSCRVSDIFSV